MKIRVGILRRSAAIMFVALACQVNCRAELVSVNSITNSATTIGLFFDPAVTAATATNPANYSVLMKTGAVSVASVTLQTNGQFVALNLASPIGEFFAVTASNVVDVASATNNAYTIGYLSEYDSRDVGVGGDPVPAGEVYTAHDDTFEVTAGGSDVGGTEDYFHFISQQVVGDFDMATEVTRLDQADAESKAGLMARETLTPGSRTIQTYFTPTGGTNVIDATVRSTTNSATAGFLTGAPPSATPLRWLRLTRTNNTFAAYHGSNGVDWSVSGVATQAFASTLNIGMMVASHTTNGTPTVAKFANFGKRGARPGDATLPVLSGVLSGTNVALTWNRTPRHYTIEVSTNLLDWELLLHTIYESGSNATQRLMNVPLDQFPGTAFFRLVRVERVFPDPPLMLITGLIISLGNGNIVTANDSTLCSIPVRDALSQNAMTALPNKTVNFTTAASGSSLDTVLKVRRLPDLNPPCDDNSAGNLKSKQTYATTATRTNFTMVVAVKTNTPVTSTSVIKVGITVN